MGKITLHDIAEKANVSAVTVSNVLNHKGKVSEQKRKEIEAIARNMGYRPDSIAKSFRRRSSNIIGIVLSHEYPESTSAILSGAIGEAKLREQMILLSPDFRTPEEELSAIKYLVSSPIDALIYYPRNYQVDISRIIGLSSIPIVGMLRRNFGFSIPRIYADYQKIGYQTTKYLLSLGRKKIAFVYCAGNYSDIESADDLFQVALDEKTSGRFVFDDFFAGYMAALNEEGIEYDRNLVFLSDLGKKDGAKIAAEILTKGEIDAVLVGGTRFALGMYEVFHQQGISIPDDISIISYTSDSVCEALTPTLTSCAIPFEEMGRKAVFMINQLLEGREPQDIILQPQLILMNSTTKKLQPNSP